MVGEQYNQPISNSTAGWRRCDEECDAATLRRCMLRCTAMIAEGTKTGSVCRHVNEKVADAKWGKRRQDLGRLVKGSDRHWRPRYLLTVVFTARATSIHMLALVSLFIVCIHDSLSLSLSGGRYCSQINQRLLAFSPQSNLGMHAVQPNPNDLAANASLLCFACLLEINHGKPLSHSNRKRLVPRLKK